jgi:hypothetical protein
MIKDSIFLGLLGSINVSQNFPCEGRVHEARFSCWLIANICPGECKHGLDGGGGSHTSGSKAQKSPKAESKIILLPPPPIGGILSMSWWTWVLFELSIIAAAESGGSQRNRNEVPKCLLHQTTCEGQIRSMACHWHVVQCLSNSWLNSQSDLTDFSEILEYRNIFLRDQLCFSFCALIQQI